MWYAGRCPESLHQALAQVFGLVEEHLVTAQLVGSQKPTQGTNGRLKERHTPWLGKAQVVSNLEAPSTGTAFAH